MSFQFNGLTIEAIRTIFAEEIQSAGGTVAETFQDDRRLFTRSLLPWVADVRPQDRLHGGVALRATDDEVSVHPYLFRQVCRNGAIIAHSIQSQILESLPESDEVKATHLLRVAIRGCAGEDTFIESTTEVRQACYADVDLALSMIPILSRLPSDIAAQVLGELVNRFRSGSDRTRFGLMNAVTSLARDTRDPELRWRLEELGGGVPVMQIPRVRTPAAARLVPVG